MKISLWLLAILVALVSFSGCATIVKGIGGQGVDRQGVNFQSEPPDAKLTVTNLRSGTVVTEARTPHQVSMERSTGYFKYGKYHAVFEKDGYDKKEVNIEGDAGAWYIAGNLVFGGLIGWFIVDPLTGAMWTINPEQVNVVLTATENDPICFNMTEFTPPLSVEKLCTAINADKYELQLISPDNTTSRLNEILEVPDLYDKLYDKGKLPKKAGDVSLPPDVDELKKQTAEFRSSSVKCVGLNFDQQSKLKKFNRQLKEIAYPNETPKKKQ
jgi:hypothetical protein